MASGSRSPSWPLDLAPDRLDVGFEVVEVDAGRLRGVVGTGGHAQHVPDSLTQSALAALGLQGVQQLVGGQIRLRLGAVTGLGTEVELGGSLPDSAQVVLESPVL